MDTVFEEGISVFRISFRNLLGVNQTRMRVTAFSELAMTVLLASCLLGCRLTEVNIVISSFIYKTMDEFAHAVCLHLRVFFEKIKKMVKNLRKSRVNRVL